MFEISKHKFVQNVIIAIVSLAFTTAGFSASTNSARVIPTGKVSINKNGKVVGEFSKEAPLPEGSLLRCEDKCAVKIDDTYMVVDPGTEFSVTPAANSTGLYVKTGAVYYAINESSRPIQITTPSGDATTGDLTMTDSELRGYVRVSGNETEIGVIGGGTMMVETTSGDMAVTPGNAVTIALVNPDAATAAAGDEGGSGLIKDIALGIAGAGVLVAGGYLLSTTDGNHNSSKSNGSPSSP